MVLASLDGEEISYALGLEFKATNNQAEYEALIAGLELAKEVRANKVKIRTDSQLVANYISEVFELKDEKMGQYLRRVRQMIKKFESMDIVQIPRSQNYRANILARMAATTD